MIDWPDATHMATSRDTNRYHLCTCGESFETTDALLEHARAVHGIDVA